MVETDFLFPKGELASFEHEPEKSVAQHSRSERRDNGNNPAVGPHQRRQNETGDDARGRAAERDLVRNDEVFEIDKRGDDQERNENPVSDRDVPWKVQPDGEKEQRGQQFHREIAKRDPAPAIRATSAEEEPADERKILLPRNRFLARWTKRSPRFVNRQIAREPVDADVQKRADRRAQNESDSGEEKTVGDEWIGHAILASHFPSRAPLHKPRDPNAALIEQAHRQAHRDQSQDVRRGRDDGGEDKNEDDGVRPGARHEFVGH